MSHANLFHAALIAIHDVAHNGTRDEAAWWQVTAIIDEVLAKARELDAKARRPTGFDCNNTDSPGGRDPSPF